MGEFDTSFSLSSLMCQENEGCLIQEPEVKDTNTVDYERNGDEEVLIKKLFEKETSFGSKFSSDDDLSIKGQNWLKCARLDAIEWILNRRAMFGFRYQTAYLSVDYFDRFLSKRSIDDGKVWAIRLLSVACLSLAAKMEESEVPALSEFQLENYDFENRVIQRMELLVLNTLEWKMGSITPFAFLHHFVSKICGECRPNELVSKAVQLIVNITKEINLMEHRPSVIAAAAVLLASNGQLTKQTMELKMNLISGSLEIERIYSCYNLMKKIEMGNIKTPKSVVLNLSSTSLVGVFENPSLTSGAGTKRRLTYSDNDQNCPSKKIFRP